MHALRTVAAMCWAVLLVSLMGSAQAANTGFRNPLDSSADPYLSFYQGNYYLAEAVNNVLTMRRAPTLGGLLAATPKVVFRPVDPAANKDVWAPSFVILNDRIYLYYTASNGVDEQHRMYALESTLSVSGGATPDGDYNLMGKVFDASNDIWAIDGLPAQINGALYFVWSGRNGGTYNQLMIAPMSNPWTIKSARTYIPASGSCPEVREAPAILQRNQRTFLVYSTCDTHKPDYSLWMLSLNDGQDPLVASNWHQYPNAVFARNDATGVFGPGSNNFFKSPDGTEDWIAYHGKNTAASTVDGRTARAQKFGWNPDGTPNFGQPLAAGATQNVPSGDVGGGPVAINDTDTGALATGAISAPGGQCVDVAAQNSNNGTPVQLWTCNGTAAQQWSVPGDGTLRALGKCLDIVGNGTANSAKLELWECNGVGGQQWIPQANGALFNPQSGRCLDDPAYNTASGTQLALWDCNNAAPQVYGLPAATQRVAYAGTWSAGATCGVQCFWGNDHWSSEVGATVTYSVHGSQVALFSVRDTGNGIAGVSVDGGAEVLVDMYAPVRQGEQLQWLSPKLFSGNHTVRVRVTGTRNSASTGITISADRLELYP